MKKINSNILKITLIFSVLFVSNTSNAFIWFNISSENFLKHNENFFVPMWGLTTTSFFTSQGSPAFPSLQMVFASDVRTHCTNNCSISHRPHASGDIIATYATYSIRSSDIIPQELVTSKLLRIKRGNRPAFFIVDVEEPEKAKAPTNDDDS